MVHGVEATVVQPEMLYNPEKEHDACGVGIVANENAKPTRDVVTKALAGLGCQQHRGGVACDNRTGDGAGIKTQIPQKLFKDEYAALGGDAQGRDVGVGMFFMPRENEAARERCRAIVSQVLEEAGFDGVKWREVPVDTSVLGELAEENRGQIEQVIFPHHPEMDMQDMEKALYVARHRIMRMANDEQLSGVGSESFYIPSLSADSVIYKAMSLATQLANFYPDLHDDRFESAYAVFHQRFSTNTTPKWQLAHPFHFLAHNGEVNTVAANREAMKKLEARYAGTLGREGQQYVLPVIVPGRSDSADLSAAIGFLLTTSDMSLSTVKAMLVPPAKSKNMSAEDKALYDYISASFEPWDGPGTFIMSDSEMVVAGGDRGGLRPIRVARTSDGLLVVTSEVGSVPLDAEKLIENSYLEPGQMIAVDFKQGRIIRSNELTARAREELAPEIARLKNIVDLKPAAHKPLQAVDDDGQKDLLEKQVLSGYTKEWLSRMIEPQLTGGTEAIGSMGDDSPLAVLSRGYRPLSHFFRQRFAEVTNPPIDSIREAHIMDLTTHLGSFYDSEGQPSEKEVIRLPTPILSNATFNDVVQRMEGNYISIDCTFPVHGGAYKDHREHDLELRRSIDFILTKAEEAARQGKHIILTDERTGKERAGIPMILIASAVNNRLNQKGLRHVSSINVRSAECTEPHYVACLVGMGADTINSYLVEETIAREYKPEHHEKYTKNYVKSLEKGLLKIMAKMGIAPVSSYRGGRLFDAMGLSRDVTAEFFPGVESPIDGLTLGQLQEQIEAQHRRVYSSERALRMPPGSFLAIRGQGNFDDEAAEPHANTPEVHQLLFDAIQSGSYDDYLTYARLIAENGQNDPIAIRDLLEIENAEEKIEYTPEERRALIEEILHEIVTGAMSHGSISKEAHETLAVAMNRIGAKSDCGEGGENPARFGTEKNSAIKQVASGRFGVTARYLAAAKEIEIKVAQGAKPGEGGQLPGFKVTAEIAELRHVEPGTELISPPPHHDIYSIEDLAQLIHDLKQANPEARVRVKLVSEAGVGTIAAGVAKAGADVIHIAGSVGGTGASPQTSIRFAGSAWETGLAEANQALIANNLRDRVKLVTDGGMRTGRDIVIAALLGAEEYSFGTNALIAEGCVLTKQCQTDKCPVGIATQNPLLRQAFTGTPEGVIRYFEFVAADAADAVLAMGKKHIKDIVGLSNKLTQVRGQEKGINLSRMLARPNVPHATRNAVQANCRNDYTNPDTNSATTLDRQLLAEHGEAIKQAIRDGKKYELHVDVTNQDRSVGTLISSMLVREFNKSALADKPVIIHAHGHAGASALGFTEGVELRIEGDANDYVGKGLSGGTIVVFPDHVSPIARESQKHTIIGNTSFYGATGGEGFIAGGASGRCFVRNSGVKAVIEQVGSDACEYMTGGEVVVLGPVGPNFANAMTGGRAFVYDEAGTLDANAFTDSVAILQPSEEQKTYLRQRVQKHQEMTGSVWAKSILDDWDRAVNHMRLVLPKAKVPKPAAVNENKPADAPALARA